MPKQLVIDWVSV